MNPRSHNQWQHSSDTNPGLSYPEAHGEERGQKKEGRELLSTDSTHLHDRAEKTICENVWFYLWKINSAYNFIIIPFLETLTPINVVKVWEATKCLFFFFNLLLSINILDGQHGQDFPSSPLNLLIFNLERSGMAPCVTVA